MYRFHRPGRFARAVGLVWILWGIPSPLCAREFRDLVESLQALAESHEGQVSIALRHLESGEAWHHRGDVPMPTASLIKFPVMVETYRQAAEGEIDLEAPVTLREEDKVPGSGILTTHFSAGARMPLRDAVRLMIAYSDNTATNLVLDEIGLESTARAMVELGCPETKIHSKVFRPETSIFAERSRRFGLGSTTALEIAGLFERLYRRELVGAAADAEMLEHLYHCEDRDKLARFLPSDVKFAHKTGSLSSVHCDAGVLEFTGATVVIAVLTGENADRTRGRENAAGRLCAEVGRLVLEHFDPEPVRADPRARRDLSIGASGELVEALQRTLNSFVEEKDRIAVDGDFGPVTEAAVRSFQRGRDLVPTGVVDETTWRSIGTLVTSDPPVPEPGEVNGQVLPRSPPEDLSGPPVVTCRAWCIGDADTGELLWGADEDEPLAMASTTKIMTAHLVLRAAEASPDVLDEVIEISPRADATPGSTSGLRSGERLPVREALYGLLLPSGNDVAIALAEHLGPRLAGEEPDPEEDPVRLFVAAMNRRATSLDLAETHFDNPHGLTADGHHSSARDLLRLAHVALGDPLLREIVGTARRGCRVEGASGYRRNVLWRNTNRLLSIAGYRGVKTGTTREAGACLVSFGGHGEDSLLVVVLGAAASSSRYADTRNLFRWAWRQRSATEARAATAGESGRR